MGSFQWFLFCLVLFFSCHIPASAGYFAQRCASQTCIKNCSDIHFGSSIVNENIVTVFSLPGVLLLCLTLHWFCGRQFLVISPFPENWFSAHVGTGLGRDSMKEAKRERDRQIRDRKERYDWDKKQVLGVMCPSPTASLQWMSTVLTSAGNFTPVNDFWMAFAKLFFTPLAVAFADANTVVTPLSLPIYCFHSTDPWTLTFLTFGESLSEACAAVGLSTDCQETCCLE